MKGKCWNCGKINEEQPCGYFKCDCKPLGLWYLPMSVHLDRKKSTVLDEYINSDKILDKNETNK